MDGKQRTALVTGASSGMGVDFAWLLAERGCDLILTARRADRLERLREELIAAHDIRVQVIATDLSTADGAQRLFRQTQTLGLHVDVLINNAGFGIFGDFLEQTPAEIDSMLQVNIAALTTLTRLFAEQMAHNGEGFILQNSSYAGLQPIPGYSVYSGAKAYVVAFAQAIRHELQARGVHISVMCPGFAATEFHDVAGHVKTSTMRFLTLPPRAIATAGINGLLRKKFLITPGWMYRLNNLALRFLPKTWAAAISAKIVKQRTKPKQFRDTRSAA